MMKFIELRDGTNLQEIYINPSQVSYVRGAPKTKAMMEGMSNISDLTEIHLINGTGNVVVTVVGPVDLIEKKLNEKNTLLKG